MRRAQSICFCDSWKRINKFNNDIRQRNGSSRPRKVFDASAAMATYKVLYWQEIPSQIRAEDDEDEVSLPLDHRFQDRIDQLATERGLLDADDYLAQWKWSEEEEREGSAKGVAEAVKAELEAQGHVMRKLR
jgi:hypothetical protein